jgi:hypothetical protein
MPSFTKVYHVEPTAKQREALTRGARLSTEWLVNAKGMDVTATLDRSTIYADSIELTITSLLHGITFKHGSLIVGPNGGIKHNGLEL